MLSTMRNPLRGAEEAMRWQSREVTMVVVTTVKCCSNSGR